MWKDVVGEYLACPCSTPFELGKSRDRHRSTGCLSSFFPYLCNYHLNHEVKNPRAIGAGGGVVAFSLNAPRSLWGRGAFCT